MLTAAPCVVAQRWESRPSRSMNSGVNVQFWLSERMVEISRSMCLSVACCARGMLCAEHGAKWQLEAPVVPPTCVAAYFSDTFVHPEAS